MLIFQAHSAQFFYLFKFIIFGVSGNVSDMWRVSVAVVFGHNVPLIIYIFSKQFE